MDSPSLFLGIDTGGTFTDGVLINPISHQVVKKAKVLTTHHDLRLCIQEVLQALVEDDSTPIQLVSLSTTLATNAIAEGKSKPVALFLLGYDPDLIEQFGFRTQFASTETFYIRGRHNLDGQEITPLDLEGLNEQLASLDGRVQAVAISSFAATRNPEHEQIAAENATAVTHMPVVSGHHLSSNLDSIRRATTARLNASLLDTTFDFMTSVRQMLVEKGIHCPMYVVKGDGSLASADFAARRPVEIIHSGPATSAIGGRYLTEIDDALVVDVGGTTTDLILVKDGRIPLDQGGATVADFRTAVRTIRARSFGLGGDSLIRFDPRGKLSIGPQRAIPLSYLAHTHPELRMDLLNWLHNPPAVWYSQRIEYWIARKQPTREFIDPRTRRALEILQQGPMRVPELLKQVGAVSSMQIDEEALVRQDIIQRAGLTPTDLLHISGEYAPWDIEIARRVVQAAAQQWGISPQAFIEQVYNLIHRRIATEVVNFLSGCTLSPNNLNFTSTDLGRFLFEENLQPTNPYLGSQIQLKLPLIGIGAPAKIFLPAVAELLHTHLYLPEHFEVANAVGTVVGNILVRSEAEIVPWVDGTLMLGYHARAGSQQRSFNQRGEALAFARQAVSEQALEAAQASGAVEPVLDLQETELLGDMHRLVATAVGKPRIT